MQAATREVPFHPPCLSARSDSSYHWKDALQVTAAISRTPFSHTCLTDLQKCEAFAVRFVIWVFKIWSFFSIIVFILQNTSFRVSNHGTNVFPAWKNKNNLGNQKLIRGEVLAAHLTHLPSVKDNSKCVSELLEVCSWSKGLCDAVPRSAVCPHCSLSALGLQQEGADSFCPEEGKHQTMCFHTAE